MSLKIIVVGDETDHGGKVITGSPQYSIDGKAIARLGDQVDCPKHDPDGRKHGLNKIITANEKVKVDGVPVAVHDSVTECGCKLIGSGRTTVT